MTKSILNGGKTVRETIPDQGAQPSGVEVVRLEERDYAAWDRFVLGCPKALVQHTSSWIRVMERSFPHMHGWILAVVDQLTGEIQAGFPVYEVRSFLLGNRLVSVPHATFCPPLIRGELKEMERLLSALGQIAREVGIGRIELRWCEEDRLPLGAEVQGGVKERLFWHHYLDLTKPREELWRRLSRTAIRRKIREAKQAGVVVVDATGEEDVAIFHQLLAASRQRLGLPALPLKFLLECWRTLGTQHRQLWLAKQGNRILGGVLATMAGEMLAIDYYGEEQEVRNLGVNALLYWEAMCDAQEAGMARFSLGRTGMSGASDGLLEFKRRWGGVEEKLAYREIVIGARRKKTKDRLAPGISRDHLRHLFRRMPTALHRSCSNLFYRHWA